MVEACGPVQTAEGEQYCVGATRATNNTAEMEALIETLFWLNSCVEQKGPSIFQQRDDNSKTRSTSRGSSMRNSWRGKTEHWQLWLCHMWRVTKTNVTTSHTLDYEDTLVTWVISIADELADLGTRLEAQHRWWKRAQSSLQGEKHSVEEDVFASSGQAWSKFSKS